MMNWKSEFCVVFFYVGVCGFLGVNQAAAMVPMELSMAALPWACFFQEPVDMSGNAANLNRVIRFCDMFNGHNHVWYIRTLS